VHPTAANPSDPRRGRYFVVVFLVCAVTVLGVHAWLTLRLFPSWRSLVDERPVISVDHVIHLYHGFLGARSLREHGTSWGYDPSFMAGYPKTPVYDSSSAPAELFQLLAGGVYSPRAYKIGIALLVALVPIAIMLAGWGYGGGRVASVAAAAWSMWYWWVGFPDVLVRTGLVAFVWSSAVAVLVPGLLTRWGRTTRFAEWAALAAAATAGVQAHAIFPIMTALPALVGYVGGAMRPTHLHSWRWHAATWAAAAVALAATHFWCWPLIQFLHLKTASDLFMTYTGNPFVLIVNYYIGADGRVPLLMVLFGTAGLCGMWRAGRRTEAIVLTVQVLALAALTFFGSELTATRNLEPLRFQVPLGLAWSVAAGEGLAAIASALNPWSVSPGRRPKLRRLCAAVFVGVAILCTTPSFCSGRSWLLPHVRLPSTWEHSSERLQSARPLAVGLRPEMNQLVAWIRGNTDPSARILFEDQLRLLEQGDPAAPESIHWTPLLPLLTGRAFVGGLYHMAFIPHQRAAFGDWRLAGRHIRDWSADELAAFCEQYNIGWVITWSRASRIKQAQHGEDATKPLATEVFAGLPWCERVARLPRHTVRPDENVYMVFRVKRDHSYFARGRGRLVAADFNRIELADVDPDAGELVLRFHWQQGLESDPPLPIERVDAPGDPVGFIRVRSPDPLPRLVVRNRYR
jgi:hypothetical protein